MKRFSAFLLCVLLTASLFSFVSFGDGSALTVEFANDLAGSAAGVYTFSVEKAGTYALYWADESGAPLTVTLNGKSISYTAFAEIKAATAGANVYSPAPMTAIPYGAKKMIVTDQSKAVVASCDLPESKLQKKEQNYAYGMMSDLHYDSFSNFAEDDAVVSVNAAYTFFEEAGVKNVFQTGDYSTNGNELAYQRYAEGISKTGLTVLGCGGNHEVVAGFDNMYGEKGLWYQYVNKGVYDKTLEGVLEIAPNGYDFVYGIPGTNDIFIALCQVRWDNKTTSQKSLVETASVEWFASILKKYPDKNPHLLMHTFFSDDDRLNNSGEGDFTNSVGFGYHYNFNTNTAEEGMLRALFAENKDLIWFNGHSHWCFDQQKYNQNLNIFDYDGTSCTCIHVPSVTAPRTVGNTEESYHSNAGKLSEGVLMFSCDGYEVMNGVNFKTGEIDAYACYIVYRSADKTVSGQDHGVSWTYDKQTSALRITGEGEMKKYASASERPYDAYAGKVVSAFVAKGVTTVSDHAFEGMTALKRATVQEGVTAVGGSAFAGCSAVETLKLPESLREIGENAFSSLQKSAVLTFAGSPEQYEAIKVAAGNDALGNVQTVCRKRTVTWKIGDYIKIESYELGEAPAYKDAAAMPTEEQDKYLPFTGWTSGKNKYSTAQGLPKVSANATYTATFGASADRYVGDSFEKNRFSWKLDRYNGVLTVSGKGELPNFAKYTDQPWRKYENEIYTVIVTKGIDKLGKNCFAKMSKLTTIIFEGKLNILGNDSFAYCPELTTVYLPATLIKAEQGASYECTSLKNIYFAGTEEQWDKLCTKMAVYNDVLKDASDVHFGVGAPTASKFTVTFKDADGTVLSTVENVRWGESAKPPVIEDENFLGWNDTYFLVRGDMTINAVYSADKSDKKDDDPTPDLPDEPQENEPYGEKVEKIKHMPAVRPIVVIIVIVVAAILITAALIVVLIVVLTAAKKRKK